MSAALMLCFWVGALLMNPTFLPGVTLPGASPPSDLSRQSLALRAGTGARPASAADWGTLSPLLAYVAAHPGFRRLVEASARAEPGTAVGPLALADAAQSPVVAALASGMGTPLLWLTAGPEEARGLVDALRAYLARPGRVHLLPAPDALPYERIPWDPSTREARLATLAALALEADGDDGAPIVVASVRALLMVTMPPAAFKEACGVLRLGDRIAKTTLLERLQRLGYETVTNVGSPGQVAHRGGIVDIFTPLSNEPVRIEWFGDEIESLRFFDPIGQRSHEASSSLVLVPAVEALAAAGPPAAQRLEQLDMSAMHPLAQSDLRRQREMLAAGQSFPGIEYFTSLLHPEQATVLDYLPPASWLVIDHPDQVLAVAEGIVEQAIALRADQVAAGELPEDWPASPLAPFAATRDRLARHRLLWLGMGGTGGLWQPSGELPVAERRNGRPLTAETEAIVRSLSEAFGDVPRFAGRIEEAVTAMSAELLASRRAVVVVSRQAPRVAELLTEEGLASAAASRLSQAPGPGGIAVVHGALPAGWRLSMLSGQSSERGNGRELGGAGALPPGRSGRDDLPDELVLLTDGELFGWRMPHRRRAHRPAESARSADFFSDLHPNDFVVHIEHGIGRFRGIRRMDTGGVERDYLHIEYDQGDALFVPTHQADRVTRYVGTGEGEPSITRLGSADWERAKARAKRAFEDVTVPNSVVPEYVGVVPDLVDYGRCCGRHRYLLLHPVLYFQTRDSPEVAFVAGNHLQVTSQGDGGYPHVGVAYGCPTLLQCRSDLSVAPGR